MHAQSREALNHLAYTIAAGGSGPRLRDGAVKQPSKLPGRPNSRGRLSINFFNRPPTKHQNEGNSIPREEKYIGYLYRATDDSPLAEGQESNGDLRRNVDFNWI